jgi:hypothetical protein
MRSASTSTDCRQAKNRRITSVGWWIGESKTSRAHLYGEDSRAWDVGAFGKATCTATATIFIGSIRGGLSSTTATSNNKSLIP